MNSHWAKRREGREKERKGQRARGEEKERNKDEVCTHTSQFTSLSASGSKAGKIPPLLLGLCGAFCCNLVLQLFCKRPRRNKVSESHARVCMYVCMCGRV